MQFFFIVQNSRHVCEGEGLAFLKLKTKLSGFLGHEQITTQSLKSFSVPLIAAVAASSVFKEVCGEIPKELAGETDIYERHQAARDQVMQGVRESKIAALEAPWPEILDPAQAIAVSAMATEGLLGLCLFASKA